MDEQASFEARAVLAPKRARRARLSLLVPVVAFVAVASLGLGGHRPDASTAEAPAPTFTPTTVVVTDAPYPEHVLGIDVRRLPDLPAGLGRDEIVAVAGWYVTTAITDCPAVVVIRRDGALPEIRRDVDTAAYCDRSGVLFDARPDRDLRENASVPAVAATVAIGVRMPAELEAIGTGATQVVVIGHFVPTGEPCDVSPRCGSELVVDHVGWTPGA